MGGIALYHSPTLLASDAEWLADRHYDLHALECAAWDNLVLPNRAFSEAFDFPDWHPRGRELHLDALDDLLRDLEVPDRGGLAIVFRRYDHFAQQFPDQAFQILDILADHFPRPPAVRQKIHCSRSNQRSAAVVSAARLCRSSLESARMVQQESRLVIDLDDGLLIQPEAIAQPVIEPFPPISSDSARMRAINRNGPGNYRETFGRVIRLRPARDDEPRCYACVRCGWLPDAQLGYRFVSGRLLANPVEHFDNWNPTTLSMW